MENGKEEIKRYIYKNQRLYGLINKVKLWPAQTGTLHGIKNIEVKGNRRGTKFCIPQAGEAGST